MKNLFLLIVTVFIFELCPAQDTHLQSQIHIIPEPVSVTMGQGHFSINNNTSVIVENAALKDVGASFIKMLNKPTGYHLTTNENSKEENAIVLKINNTVDTLLGSEGYTLQVTPGKVIIAANKPQGVFYGIQSLIQLLPSYLPAEAIFDRQPGLAKAGIEGDTVAKNVQWNIPCVQITDYPRFKWRGLMLDVSRHFFTKDEVKRYIDEMAKYKYNVFHWHLSDDQGWRIEIKGLPKLTDVGAWRVPRTGRWGTFEDPQPEEKATDGGYYTQDDIREIISYAQKRFVTILPEIDVPGHSLSLIASYSNLSCTQKQYPVSPQYTPNEFDNVLCVANDSTWLILDKIFTQVAKLFPSEYIHVGGDEANRKFWTKDPKDMALMKKEGIETPAGLQSYFEKKLEKLILSKGKKMIGWDEILEGGLAPEATVMSWRGMKGGIKAAQMGHHVIMSPYGQTYISQLQGDPLVEPAGPGMTRLKECYETSILPKGVTPEMVLGGEACLWTEYVPNFRHAEYMTWPRALALSEVFWGTKSTWDNFTRRVEEQLKYLDASQVKYARSMFDPIISAVKKDDTLKVVLTTETPGLDLYYTFDGTNPDTFFPKYNGEPLDIPKGAFQINVVTYKGGKQIGHQINCPVSTLEKRVPKK